MVAFSLVPQRRDADAEGRRCIFESGRQRENTPDVLLLDLLERRSFGQVSVRWSARLKKDVGQIFPAQHPAAAQHDCAFDGIAQFADVARP